MFTTTYLPSAYSPPPWALRSIITEANMEIHHCWTILAMAALMRKSARTSLLSPLPQYIEDAALPKCSRSRARA